MKAARAALPGEALPEMMTVEELAARMGIDRKTAYDLVATGDVPGVKRLRPRCIRIHRPTIDAWLACDMRKS